MKAAEITIKAPWGHIAGKIWGGRAEPVALMFHGVGDNAGSFDRLVPHLPPRYRYASIDLPGHGFSSHFPAHVPLYGGNDLLAYRLVCEHFGQRRYVLIGHSYGAQLGAIFAQLYPRVVERLVMLDAIHMYPIPADRYAESMVSGMDRFLDMEIKLGGEGGRPAYTYEEAFDRLLKNRMVTAITPEGAAALMERSVAPTPDGRKYYFTSDPRLKFYAPPVTDHRYILETLRYRPLKCPVLIVLADGNPEQQILFERILEAFRAMENFTIVNVDGLHDVHNDHPERVAPTIVNFLGEGDKKAKL